MRSLYEVILKEFFNLFKYCYAFIYEHYNGTKKIIVVVLYVCFQVCIVLISIEAIGTKAVDLFSKTNNYVSSTWSDEYENSIINCHLFPNIIYPNGTEGENISGTVEILCTGLKQTVLRDIGPLKVTNTYEENNYYPVPAVEDRKEIKRFVGEDVEFKCDNHRNPLQNLGTDVSKLIILRRRYYWPLDGRKLRSKPDGRIYVENTQKTIGHITSSGTKLYGSNLTILGIEEQDFGIYACVQNIVARKSQNENMTQIFKLEMQRYILIEIERYVNVTYAPLGNVLRIMNVDVNILNDSPVLGFYTINNIPADQVCKPGEPACAAHLPVSLLLRSIWYGYLETVSYIFWPQVPNEDGQFECKQNLFRHGSVHESNFKWTYCLCSSAYGWHRVYMIRQLYDSKWNTSKMIKLLYPIERLVLPKGRYSWLSLLFPFMNNTELYEEITQEAVMSNTRAAIEERILKLIRSNELNIFIFDTFLYFGQLICVLVFMIKVRRIVVNAYCKYIVYVGLNFINNWPNVPFLKSPEDMNETKEYAKDEYEYDMFVSHSEDENDWIIHTLVPLLENDSQLKVCFPDRDLEPGQRMMESYTAVICNSRMILVILSNGYMNDKYKKKLQLDYMILPLIYEIRLLEENVLFIRYHPVKLERPLQW